MQGTSEKKNALNTDNIQESSYSTPFASAHIDQLFCMPNQIN